MRFVILALALLASAAHADTLTPQTCSYFNPTTGTCSKPQLSFTAAQTIVVVDGVSYIGPGLPSDGRYVNVPLYAEDGSSLTLSAQLTAHSQYVSSARARYYKHWFSLDSGSITF